jgi:hypothetical protein
MKQEQIKLMEVRARLANMGIAAGVKCTKLQYALSKNRLAYLALTEPLKVFARTDEETELATQIAGKESIPYPKMIELMRAADQQEIADKFQGEFDALSETVDVSTYTVKPDDLPSDIDGYSFHAIEWVVDFA